MEAALLAVKIRIRAWLGIVPYNPAPLLARIEALESELCSFKDALKARAQKAESVFDKRDTVPSVKPQRYVPVAARRRMAEAESMGPVEHKDRVRDNNARAMEGM